MDNNCDPTYGKVDDLLELLTKSKSLHILLVLDRGKKPLRFSEIKKRVDSSSTTVTRRLRELEKQGLVLRTGIDIGANTFEYTISNDAKSLSPIMQSLFDWVAKRNQ